jgi:hypothetical protein
LKLFSAIPTRPIGLISMRQSKASV